jgi:hypothetical protein
MSALAHFADSIGYLARSEKCHKKRLCDFSGGLDKTLCHHPHDSHSYPPAGRHYGCRPRSACRNRGSTVHWLRTWGSILPHFHQQGEPPHSELVPLNSRSRHTDPRQSLAHNGRTCGISSRGRACERSSNEDDWFAQGALACIIACRSCHLM